MGVEQNNPPDPNEVIPPKFKNQLSPSTVNILTSEGIIFTVEANMQATTGEKTRFKKTPKMVKVEQIVGGDLRSYLIATYKKGKISQQELGNKIKKLAETNGETISLHKSEISTWFKLLGIKGVRGRSRSQQEKNEFARLVRARKAKLRRNAMRQAFGLSENENPSDFLKDIHHVQKLSVKEIARCYNQSSHRIEAWLENEGIKRIYPEYLAGLKIILIAKEVGLFSLLTPLQREYIEEYYFNVPYTKKPPDYSAIARKKGVTRENVTQQIASALKTAKSLLSPDYQKDGTWIGGLPIKIVVEQRLKELGIYNSLSEYISAEYNKGRKITHIAQEIQDLTGVKFSLNSIYSWF
ncbi:hypothetical protein HYT02_02055 [Candidatus Gottesmanbacteria bacterium]|nr:hypothetical protein [Candidatus Gottesmanbacteria bacterium]